MTISKIVSVTIICGSDDQQPEIERHADCGEEDLEQQAFERRDVGLELVAIAAFSEQRAGNEGAERGR